MPYSSLASTVTPEAETLAIAPPDAALAWYKFVSQGCLLLKSSTVVMIVSGIFSAVPILGLVQQVIQPGFAASTI